MKTHAVLCLFQDGPFKGRRVLFVRVLEHRLLPESLYFRLGGDGDCLQYTLDASNRQAAGLVFKYVGVEADDPDDTEIVDERCEPAEFPDGTPASKTRCFYTGGPFDGGSFTLLYPPDLFFGGVDLAMEWDYGLGASAGDSFHVYAPLSPWQFPDNLAPDVWPYEWTEAKAAAQIDAANGS